MALNGATNSSSLNAMQHSAQLYSAKLNASISPVGALGALGGQDHLNTFGASGSAPLYVTGPFGN